MRRTENKKTWTTIKTAAAIIFLIAILTSVSLLVSRPPKTRYEGYPIGSTYSADPGGCELMYLLFSDIGFDCVQHRKPILKSDMPDKGADIIWHNSAVVPLGQDEVDWVDDWVKEGGTLVLVDNPLRMAASSSGMYGVQKDDILIDNFLDEFLIESGTRDVTNLGGTSGYNVMSYRVPVWSRNDWELGYVDEVDTYKRQGIAGPMVYRFTVRGDESSRLKVMLKDGYGTVVVMAKHGSGRIWFISDPYLFSTMLIQDADNAILASSIAAGARGGDFSSILFDEYHLGFTQSVSLADAVGTPVGLGILYLCAVGILAIATAGARFGPVRKPKGAIGVSQRAFVNALAGLWLGANAVPAAADALWRRYGARKGVRRKGLDKDLDRLRSSRGKVDELLEISRKLDL